MVAKYCSVKKNHEKQVTNLSSKLDHDYDSLKTANEAETLKLKELSRKRLEEVKLRSKGYS